MLSICQLNQGPSKARSEGFTLVEVLITIVILSIGALIVIPSMGSTNVLRVQGATRQIASDIMFAQADAMAYQSRRAIWFNTVATDKTSPWTFGAGNGYTIAEVNGPELDLSTDALIHPDDSDAPFSRDFNSGDFGGATITSADFDGDELLVFDELGGPAAELTGPSSGGGGTIMVVGGAFAYRIQVAQMTGRVTVESVDDIDDDDEGEEEIIADAG